MTGQLAYKGLTDVQLRPESRKRTWLSLSFVTKLKKMTADQRDDFKIWAVYESTMEHGCHQVMRLVVCTAGYLRAEKGISDGQVFFRLGCSEILWQCISSKCVHTLRLLYFLEIFCLVTFLSPILDCTVLIPPSCHLFQVCIEKHIWGLHFEICLPLSFTCEIDFK